jgi:hypothetical protein
MQGALHTNERTSQVEGMRIGLAALIVLLMCWSAIFAAGLTALPDGWGINIWIITLSMGLPSAFLAGFRAGWTGSRWWYLVSGASLATGGWMLFQLASSDI